MTVGEKIRALRRERNWTQDELAEKLELNGRHLSRYENDHIRPKPRLLKKIAEVFDVTMEELTRGENIETIKSLIPDEELFKQFQEVVQLDNEEKYAIKVLLNAFITKKKMQAVLSVKGTC